MLALALLLLVVCFSACEREPLVNAEYPSFDFVTGSFVDDRNGLEYGWVQVGNLRWMRNNLAWAPFDADSVAVRDGIARGVLDRAPFDSAGNIKNGYYYTFSAATQGVSEEEYRGVCPQGWELPDTADFSDMFDALHSSYAVANSVFLSDSGEYDFPWDPTYSMSLVVKDSAVIHYNRLPEGSWSDSLGWVFDRLVELADSCVADSSNVDKFSGIDSLADVRSCAWGASGYSSDTLFRPGKKYYSVLAEDDGAEEVVDVENNNGAEREDSGHLRATDTLVFDYMPGLKIYEYYGASNSNLSGFYWMRNTQNGEGLTFQTYPDWGAFRSSKSLDFYANVRCVQRVNERITSND